MDANTVAVDLAKSVFLQAADRGKVLSAVRQWVLSVQARIGYATLRDGTGFDEPASLARRKAQRQSFALPA